MTKLDDQIANVEASISRTSKMLATMNRQRNELLKQTPFPCPVCKAKTVLGEMIYLRCLHYDYDGRVEYNEGECECPKCGSQLRFTDPKKMAGMKYLFGGMKDKYDRY